MRPACVLRKIALSLLLAACLLPLPAASQSLRATVKEWRLYTLPASSGGKDSCYMVSYPVKSAGNVTKRGKAYLLVADKGGTRDEINASSGYPYGGSGKASAEIDGKRHTLFAEKDTAWAPDEAADRAIVTAMKKGKLVRIKGISQKGTSTTDRYDLSGFADAYKRMKALCRS